MNLELGLAAADQQAPISIRELVLGAKEMVDQLPMLWVEGEVEGFKAYDSGVWYFTLKDRQAQISCVVFRDDARLLRERPENGLKVWARGHLSVALRTGRLQFVVRKFLPTTEGGWHQARIEQARAALEKDGLLAPERKRPLPPYPARIGVVTSPEGAVWHDIVAVVARRWPLCELILIGARVQGDEAPRDLVRALMLAARVRGLDLVIVARGGGAQADLVAFNDERVARAVAASPVPVISAVGHETDVTLTDLVADRRAPTPSAAAEAAVPDRSALLRLLSTRAAHLGQAAGNRVATASHRLDAQASRLAGAVDRRVVRARHLVDSAVSRMAAACERRLTERRGRADRCAAQLDALSPLRVLERGYAVPRDETGRVLRQLEDFPVGRAFRLRVADGEVPARVEAG